MAKKKIVIVGGGFGGLKTALELSKSKEASVTLISERDCFWYFPTMYKTATGAPEDLSSIPLDVLTKDKNIKLIISRALSVDYHNQIIKLDDGSNIKYDFSIFALGVVTNYFGIKGIAEHSFGVKSIDEVNKLKNHLHNQIVAQVSSDLHYVIVGGGPTGIETAGEISNYLRHIQTRHGLKPKKVKVDLIEAAPRLLPRMHKSVGEAIAKRLRKLGVKISFNSAVQGETASELILKSSKIDTETVIWTAGQTNNPFFKNNNFVLDERGKVVVNDQLEAYNNLYVIGDNANTTYSGLAQTAIYDGNFVAKDIANRITNKNRSNYKPKKPISVIPVGDKWAFVEWGSLRFYGKLGWLLREAADMIGFLDISEPLSAGDQWLKNLDPESLCSICD